MKIHYLCNNIYKATLFVVGLFMVLVGLAEAQPAFQDPATAVPDLIVKVAGEKGMYTRMFNELNKVCTTPVMQSSPAKGSPEAIASLLSNKASVIFTTLDSLYGKKLIEQDNDVDKLRVLMPMYTAEVHIVARRTDTSIGAFSGLANKRVGTYGSGNISGRILMGKAGIRPVSLTDYANEDAVLAALAKNEVDVAFITVGQPAAWAEALNANTFKLVPFDMQAIAQGGGYSLTKLRYPNLSTVAVPAVGVQVSLVTYDYESPKKRRDLSLMKQCIANNISDLRETTGNSPKWREVQPNAKSDWQMFQVGAVEGTRKGKK